MELSQSDEIWRRFETSGKISDYIEFKSCNCDVTLKGDLADDNCTGTCGFGTSSWRS